MLIVEFLEVPANWPALITLEILIRPQRCGDSIPPEAITPTPNPVQLNTSRSEDMCTPGVQHSTIAQGPTQGAGHAVTLVWREDTHITPVKNCRTTLECNIAYCNTSE